MRALLRAELARVRARSVVWGTAIILVVAGLGLVIAAWDDTRPPSAAQVAEGEAAYADYLEFWLEDHDEQRAVCERNQARDTVADWDCERLDVQPTLEEFLVQGFLPYRPGLVETVDARFGPVGWLLVVGLLVMGVSLVSADFASGAFGTWLTFAPRRGRVLLSRLGASLVAAVVVSLVALASTAAGIVGVLVWNDALKSGDGAAAALFAQTAARALVAGLWATTVALGLAFALRHAAGVTGLVVWWVAGIETALPTIVPTSSAWTLATNLRAWLDGGTTYAVESCWVDEVGVDVCGPVEHVVTQLQGGLVLLAVALVCVGLGALVFRVRDVS